MDLKNLSAEWYDKALVDEQGCNISAGPELEDLALYYMLAPSGMTHEERIAWINKLLEETADLD